MKIFALQFCNIVFLMFLTISTGVIAENQQSPDFSLKTSEGKISLKDLQGKVVYLDFWASWCEPCQKAFPWMNDIQKRYQDKGLVVLAINIDSNPELALKFLTRYPANFNIAFDPNAKTAKAYKVPRMPSSYIIDREGNIVARHVGFRDADKLALEKSINQFL